MWKQHWPKFSGELQERLQKGFEAYGDGSFERPPSELMDEIAEEFMDVIGWSFIMLCALEEIKKHQARLDKEHKLDGIARLLEKLSPELRKQIRDELIGAQYVSVEPVAEGETP
jgi:hypothetical protein